MGHLGIMVHNVNFNKLLAHTKPYMWPAVERPVGCTANSLKRQRWLMVEKGILNSLVTALVDILAVSMPIVRSLKT
jgi:hypothetical protein